MGAKAIRIPAKHAYHGPRQASYFLTLDNGAGSGHPTRSAALSDLEYHRANGRGVTLERWEHCQHPQCHLGELKVKRRGFFVGVGWCPHCEARRASGDESLDRTVELTIAQ